MSFIDMLNYILTNVLGADFSLISLAEMSEKIATCTDWEKLLFDWQLVSSLVVYFSLFYLIYYILMKLPFKALKRLLGQKK